jgi:hypothetical protein
MVLNNMTMDKLNWKSVMFLAVTIMLMGFGLSFWAINADHQILAITGLIVMITVCVSWWFWVMFVIRTIIECTNKTLTGIGEVKEHLGEVKALVQTVVPPQRDK